jgi:LuxR family transcriptional activator of bioluminescence operon
MITNLEEFHNSLFAFSNAADVDALFEICDRYREQLGFDTFTYALRVPTYFSDSRLVLISGYPEQWVDHYFEQSFNSIDPVILYCAQHIIPIQWKNLTTSDENGRMRVMNEARDFGLKTGISMPIHSPHGELGVLSLALNHDGNEAGEITTRAMPYVQLIAGHLHEAVRRVSGLVNKVGEYELTAREKECLRWAADGKTSWEIAAVLSTSERTVNFHLNNAMVKLDVNNRQHAVAKAVLLGLIHPHPF